MNEISEQLLESFQNPVTLYIKELTIDMLKGKLLTSEQTKELLKYFNYRGKTVWRMYVPEYDKAMLEIEKQIIEKNLSDKEAINLKRSFVKAIGIILTKKFRNLGFLKPNERVSLAGYTNNPDRYQYANGYLQTEYEENIANERIAQQNLLHSKAHKDRAEVLDPLPIYNPTLFKQAYLLAGALLKKKLFMLLGAEHLLSTLANAEKNYLLGINNTKEVIILDKLVKKVLKMWQDPEIKAFVDKYNDYEVYGANVTTNGDYVDTYRRIVHKFLEIPTNEEVDIKEMRFAYLSEERDLFLKDIRKSIIDFEHFEENNDVEQDSDILDPIE